MDEAIELGDSNHNIEVNFDEFESVRSEKASLQEEKFLASDGLESVDLALTTEEATTPSVEDKKPKRRNLFRLGRKKDKQSETEVEQAEEEPVVDESGSEDLHEEVSEASSMWTLKRRNVDRERSYIYEEEDPEQLPEDVESDEEGLRHAEAAEGLLESALRLAERERGENIFSLSKSPRSAAIEFGRQVSALAGFPAGEHYQDQIGRSQSLLSVDDQQSVHSMNSQGTATTFIRIPKVDPSTITAETWDAIMASVLPVYSPSADDDDDIVYDSPDEEKEEGAFPAHDVPASPPRNASPPPDLDRMEAAAETARARKWDKLRNTLEAQEKGTSVGYEAQLDSQKPKRQSPLRMGTWSKGLCESLGGGLRMPRKTPTPTSESNDFSLVLGPIPDPENVPSAFPETDEKHFDVNINVEDLTKSSAALDISGDTDLESDEEEQQLSQIEKMQDLEEAESMEVVYLGSDDSDGPEDISPPFPSRLVFAL